jgi:hypothetical protein
MIAKAQSLAESGLLFPIGLTAGALISLYTVNAAYISINELVRPLVISLAMAAVLCGAYAFLGFGSVQRSLLAGLIMLSLLTYGQFYGLFEGASVFGWTIGRHRYQAAILVGLLTLVNLAVIPRRHHLWTDFGKALTVVGAAALVLPLLSWLTGGGWARNQASSDHEARLATPQLSWSVPEQPPDIYYLVLDGYGRTDVLRDYYEFDNSSFIGALEARGFNVAEAATSNYMQTRQSLVSSLNMDYLPALLERAGSRPASFPFASAIRDSWVRELLESAGYQVYAFETGLPETELDNADVYLSYQDDPRYAAPDDDWRRLSTFEGLLFESTALRIWYELVDPLATSAEQGPFAGTYGQHRARITFTFDRIQEIAALEGPKFVFAHVVAPHPPFVFGANGEVRNPDRPFNLVDGDAYQGTHEEYLVGYKEQLQYVNRLLLTAIDGILAASERPPIILVQGDHGPGAYLVWDSYQATELRERFGILSAYYFGGELPEEFGPTITPVNSFRLILRHFFGAQLRLLPDERFYADRRQPFDLRLVPAEQVLPPQASWQTAPESVVPGLAAVRREASIQEQQMPTARRVTGCQCSVWHE